MHSFVIEGTKGAGKSTAIADLVRHMDKRGLKVTVAEPFRYGNEHFKDDGGLFGQWIDENKAVDAMRWLYERSRMAWRRAQAGGSHAIIWDRQWLTAFRAIEDSAMSAREKDFWKDRWLSAEFPTTNADMVFLHCQPEVTFERRQGQLDAVSGLDTEAKVVADYDRRAELVREYGRFCESLESPEAGSDEVIQFIMTRMPLPANMMRVG